MTEPFGRFLRGFTLLELLLVVTLIALVGSVSVFTLYERMDDISLTGAAQKLLMTAKYARIVAARQHRACILHLHPQDQTYHLRVRHLPKNIPKEVFSSKNLTLDPSHRKPVTLAEGVRMGQIVVDSERFQRESCQIYFYPDGSASAALIQLVSGTNSITMLIYPATGKAILRKGLIQQLPTQSYDLDKQKPLTMIPVSAD